jgi:putative tricarboxylic transport membrane protein
MTAQRIALGCWAAIALAIAAGAIRLGTGDFAAPGPGFMPLLAAVLILASVAAGAALGVRGVVDDVVPSRDFAYWRRPVLGMAALLAWALLVTRMGFVPSTFLLMVFLFRVAGIERWPVAVILGAGAAAGAWLLFAVALAAQLPKGPLGF